MNRILSPSLFVLCIMAIVCLRCSNMGGGTIETTNGCVIGMLTDTTGRPTPHVIVHLLPAEFDPVKDIAEVLPDTTDSKGMYSFKAVAPGNYVVQGVSTGNGMRVQVSGIQVKLDSTLAQTGALRPPGVMKVTLPDGISQSTGYIYIPGSKVFVVINSNMSYALLDSVPAGVVPRVSYSSLSNKVPAAIRCNVAIAPSETSVVANPLWKYARTLVLNTSASGVDIKGGVARFPVLVRLNASNFDFSQARQGGADIRFTRTGNAFLPYEIERWDESRSQAEIWVRVDTLLGSDSSQALTMYWGNESVADSSNGAAVFDTSNGFIGVWHMNEDPSAGTGSIKDRTANAHNATPFGSMTTSNSVDGTIGKALSLNGINDYLNAGNVSVGANYSIGLWILMDTLGDYRRIISKDSSYTFWYDKDSASIRMEHMPIGSWWRGMLQDGGTRQPVTTGVWYYFVGSYDGSNVRLYTDGVEVSVSGPISEIPRTNSKPVSFGESTGHSFVKGIMDEIRIEGVARSSDWIRLCYKNQGKDDKLVQFK